MAAGHAKSGKTFEFCILKELETQITSGGRECEIIQNGAFNNIKNFHSQSSEAEKETRNRVASPLVKKIVEIEHKKIKNCNKIQLFINPDKAGESGDPRDIIVKALHNEKCSFSFGISAKWNSNEIKSHRLTESNPGERLCSLGFSAKGMKDYLKLVQGITSASETEWKNIEDLPSFLFNKGLIYRAVRDIYMQELGEILKNREDSIKNTENIFNFLCGKEDYYHVVFNSNGGGVGGRVVIKGFNFKNSLSVNKIEAPNKLCDICPYMSKSNHSDSNNRFILQLNNGWSFLWRIKNGDTKMKSGGLKFSITLDGIPIKMFNHSISINK